MILTPDVKLTKLIRNGIGGAIFWLHPDPFFIVSIFTEESKRHVISFRANLVQDPVESSRCCQQETLVI